MAGDDAPEGVMDAGDETTAAWEVPLTHAGWPPALIKAVGDPFVYALSLRDGTLLCFEHVKPDASLQWAVLTLRDADDYVFEELSRAAPASRTWLQHTCSFERGLEVRVADIVCVADAPYGS